MQVPSVTVPGSADAVAATGFRPAPGGFFFQESSLPSEFHRTGTALAISAALCLFACAREEEPPAAGVPPAAPPAPEAAVSEGPAPARSEPGGAEITEAALRQLPVRAGPNEARDLYLNLMKLSLTDLLYENDPIARAKRIRGGDWPSRAYTMIGVKRLNNIQECMEDTLAAGVPGDFIEAGAWRGGATIFMRAVLKAYGVTDRVVWVADSFEGMPTPDPVKYPDELKLDLSDEEYLAVSQEAVERHFRRYGLLDAQVKFLKGWFKDTFPTAPIEELAMLRLDADLYESTTDALVHLYPKLSSGGCLIVDDYFIKACRRAIHDYRKQHGITEEILRIDHKAVYWKKQ